jgi:flagellar M-ring protein FliF
VSKSVRHVVQNPGRVRRMTAAIVVNDRLLRAASQGTSAQWQPWTNEAMHNLTLLAQASVGFDASRGDVLTVEDLAFDEDRGQSPAPVASRLLTTAEHSPVLIKYIALLVGLLVVVMFGVRPALRLSRTAHGATARIPAKCKVGGLQSESAAELAIPSTELVPSDPERIRAQEIFEQVTGHLKREPTQSSRLLQSWIHSD